MTPERIVLATFLVLGLSVSARAETIQITIEVNIAPKQTGRLVLNKPSSIDYFCKYHPNMRGRVTVAQ